MTESEWLTCTDPQRMLSCLNGGSVAAVHPDSPGPHIEHMPMPRISERKLRLFACACVRQVWNLLTDDHSRRAIEVTERYSDGKATEKEMLWAGQAVDPFASDVMWLRRLPECMCIRGGISSATVANLLRVIVGNPFRPAYVVHRNGGEWAFDAETVKRTGKRCVSIGMLGKCVLLDREWLTPTVLAIAEQAYNERPGQKCRECFGSGKFFVSMGTPYDPPDYEPCKICNGTRRIEDGKLDQDVLNVLADALEDAGCVGESRKCEECGGTGYSLGSAGDRGNPVCSFCYGTKVIHYDHPILAALRSDEPKYRGAWCLDVILGKE